VRLSVRVRLLVLLLGLLVAGLLVDVDVLAVLLGTLLVLVGFLGDADLFLDVRVAVRGSGSADGG
jgi:hypothetical protein